MRLRSLAPYAALAFILLTLSGCVYLRLLSFKGQLNAFDDHVVVDRSQGLALRFADPVVRDEDFVFITESQPTSIQADRGLAEAEDWHWRFEKKAPDEQPDPFSIVLTTRFEKGLLSSIAFDPKLLEAVPPEFIEEIFRSLGRAKINKLRRSATAAISRETLRGMELPSMGQVTAVMGQPTQIRKKAKAHLWRYVFNFYSPEDGELSGQFAIVFKTESESLEEPINGFELTGKAR